MGYGDALMATAQARVLFQETGRKVAFGDGTSIKHGAPEHEVFRHNPCVATAAELAQGEPVTWAENYSGHRPYVDRARMEREFAKAFPGRQFTMKERSLPWRFTGWSAKTNGPGQMFLTDEERARARQRAGGKRFAVVEAGVKQGASPNKAWPLWEVVTRKMRMSFVQFNCARPFADAWPVRTTTFREACALLEHATIYIGTEGGLHHAAAAMGVPAVVYYGGYISPNTTGYLGQYALYRSNGSPCGQRVPCQHCRDIAADITVDEALSAITEVLSGTR